MADQPSISSILAALGMYPSPLRSFEVKDTDPFIAAQRPNAAPAPNQPGAYQQPPQSQPQNAYPAGGGYSLPQPVSSGNVDLSSIKPVNSGTVSIASAIAKAKAIAAEKGVSYERPPSYNPPEPRLPVGRQYRSSRSRSRSPPPARRDAFRDNFNPYRDERRGDRGPPGRDYRERSFSPGLQGRASGATFPPQNNGGYPPRDRSPARASGVDDNVESISIESNLVGLIIGRQGENLRRVEAETGCRVQFITGPDESGPYRQCKITGPRALREEAKAEMNRIIEDSGLAATNRGTVDRAAPPPARASSHQPALRDGEDSMQIMVPDRTVGLIIGRGGETIRDLQERSGCHVNIVGEQKSVNGLRPVNLIGSREAAAHAKDLIMEIVESDSKGTPKDRVPAPRESARDAGYGGSDKTNDTILVPSEAVGMIIGKGGETIKEMQSTTGCKINVTPSSGPGEIEREIGLVGSRDAIAAAKRAIEDKVEAVVSSLWHIHECVLIPCSNRRVPVGDVAANLNMGIVRSPALTPTPTDRARHRLLPQLHKKTHTQLVRWFSSNPMRYLANIFRWWI